MMYEIHSKSDFETGVVLTVNMPEEDIDKKAFNTMLYDQPEFVLPFRYRKINGQIEFTYHIENRSKFTYLSGNRSLSEYADLWLGLLEPLIDCGNWFMKPYSFVLKSEYLFCDKTGKSFSYVYIPSVQDFSDYNALKSMVTEVAKQNHVTDVNLENKVVWGIQDFNPVEFLLMVKSYKSNIIKGVANQHIEMPMSIQQIAQPEQPALRQVEIKQVIEHQLDTPVVPINPIQKGADGDIIINLSADKKKQKKEKTKGSLFGSQKVNKVKSSKEPKSKVRFGSKKEIQPQEIILGAAVMPQQIEPIVRQAPSPLNSSPLYIDDGVTQIDCRETGAPKLRYAGSGNYPRFIEIAISKGGIYTIGRYDASIGTKQSNFEFDRKTKEVSRRHAAIERNEDGYSIVDLDSKAGTFINGQKIPPNTPLKIENGYHVSFGRAGTDYIWEE